MTLASRRRAPVVDKPPWLLGLDLTEDWEERPKPKPPAWLIGLDLIEDWSDQPKAEFGKTARRDEARLENDTVVNENDTVVTPPPKPSVEPPAAPIPPSPPLSQTAPPQPITPSVVFAAIAAARGARSPIVLPPPIKPAAAPHITPRNLSRNLTLDPHDFAPLVHAINQASGPPRESIALGYDVAPMTAPPVRMTLPTLTEEQWWIVGAVVVFGVVVALLTLLVLSMASGTGGAWVR